MKTTFTHGGARSGAGRKASEPTQVIRVPAAHIPTIRELVVELKQKSALSNVLEIAEPFQRRIEPALPLYACKVSAGFPSPADDYLEKRLSPSDYLIGEEAATFFVRVKGDSMIDAGIFDNDVLVVDRARPAQLGDIVLAVLDGEFTVKTLGDSKQGPRLIPANRHYPVITIKAGQSFEIWGVVTGSMRKFK